MKITEAADLDGSVEEVFALRTTEAFQDEKCARSSPLRHTVVIHREGDHTIIHTVRAMATDALPEAARRATGAELHVDETQDWGPADADGSRSADVWIRLRGLPVTLTGTLTLSPTAAGSHQALAGSLRAAIPIVGGRIEHYAAMAITRGFDIEAQLVGESLRGGR